MNQSYAIFVNNSTVILCDKGYVINENEVEISEPNEAEMLSNIEFLEHSANHYTVCFVSENLEALRKKFYGLFKLIIAAGGFVTNDENDVLMIFRRGKWDLPKGKVEKKEAIETAAVREVEEETGISNVKLKEHLLTTYHIYTLKEKRILKETHWYNMNSNYNKPLKPQLEEDITEVRWVKKSQISALLFLTYDNIRKLFYINNYIN